VACEIVTDNNLPDTADITLDTSTAVPTFNDVDINNFISDPEGLHYYTGLENYANLCMLCLLTAYFPCY